MSWWIAESEHTLTQDVPAPPDPVRDFYVDLDNIKLVHSLIVSVTPVSRSDGPDGYLLTYRVVDRIPLGPFAMKITYRARLRVPAHGDVTTEADQSPGVRLRGRVSFELIETGTRVTERIRIAAPLPLAPVTTREAVKAHVADAGRDVPVLRSRLSGPACATKRNAGNRQRSTMTVCSSLLQSPAGWVCDHHQGGCDEVSCRCAARCRRGMGGPRGRPRPAPQR